MNGIPGFESEKEKEAGESQNEGRGDADLDDSGGPESEHRSENDDGFEESSASGDNAGNGQPSKSDHELSEEEQVENLALPKLSGIGEGDSSKKGPSRASGSAEENKALVRRHEGDSTGGEGEDGREASEREQSEKAKENDAQDVGSKKKETRGRRATESEPKAEGIRENGSDEENRRSGRAMSLSEKLAEEYKIEEADGNIWSLPGAEALRNDPSFPNSERQPNLVQVRELFEKLQREDLVDQAVIEVIEAVQDNWVEHARKPIEDLSERDILEKMRAMCINVAVNALRTDRDLERVNMLRRRVLQREANFANQFKNGLTQIVREVRRQLEEDIEQTISRSKSELREVFNEIRERAEKIGNQQVEDHERLMQAAKDLYEEHGQYVDEGMSRFSQMKMSIEEAQKLLEEKNRELAERAEEVTEMVEEVKTVSVALEERMQRNLAEVIAIACGSVFASALLVLLVGWMVGGITVGG